MKNSDYCNVDNLQFGSTSVRYLRELEDTVSFGNSLAIGVSSIPLIEIFSDRKYTGVVKRITKQDWEEFGQALQGVRDITRFKAESISATAYERTKGKEREFWKCMYRALR